MQSGFDGGDVAGDDERAVEAVNEADGDIGRLAVCGTVNDVATSGAQVASDGVIVRIPIAPSPSIRPSLA